MASRPSIPTRTAAVALLAMLGCWLASPTARAGCRHPGARDARPEAARLDLLADVGALAAAEPSIPKPTTPSPSPCSGLRCSSDPAPASPSTSAPGARVDRWVHLTAPVPPPSYGSALLAPASTALRPSHGGPSPFHPPRRPIG
ncbi:hypothetical protein [Paludisphaera soli]|uniref:hypothetical protein n=1 Tax=Paludisphaera soli TaxID=2712865 RepID=UPI0013EDCD00|nr:hypothetical protein [Paludisphaera soli]